MATIDSSLSGPLARRGGRPTAASVAGAIPAPEGVITLLASLLAVVDSSLSVPLARRGGRPTAASDIQGIAFGLLEN
jgi:hypothetical protein